ncbi:MAG TPA: multidrug efflux RND transporter permease subunit [Chthoniobacterales bacterium]|nr:multidrug efflux RND transporter permease subunit [Chthoniobacterales bacterium]
MSISEPFIRRPVATSLMMAGVILLGALGYKLLPISALPTVDFPTIEVTTFYPGASADVMVSAITTPLERQFGQIAGLASMNSTSSFGTSTITLQFVLDRPIDVAAQDVQAAINVAGGFLPKDLPNPPKYNKVNPADTPILTLSITSDSLPLDRVNDFADTLLAQKLSEVTGVGLVTIQGNQKPAVRVQVNPAAISSLGLGLEDVRTILGQANVNAPKGSFDGARQSFTIGSNDQIFSADAYKPIIVAYKNGAPIRLGNLANVIDSVENDQLGAWVSNRNGEQPAVLLDIQRQPGANIIQTVERVKQLLPRLTSTLPPSVHVEVLADRTETIRASFSDVQLTLLLTIALVVMVMFLFLRKLWTTVITSVALPLSLIGTFGIMYLAGFSLDNLSLMALTISTGFVVDDAIVMIENIVRYIEAGDTPLEAALKGAKQIGFTVVSLSVSLVAVFIPLLFMTGIVGRLFREFAITLSVAVGVSAFVSLTLTPMMCAKLLRSESEDEEHSGEFYRRTEEYWTRFRDWYERGLRWVLAHQRFVLNVALLTLVATILLYVIVPKGLLPQQDTGVIVGVTDAAENISFKAMMERVHAVSEIVRQDPDVASVSASVGAGTVNATVNTARLYIVLKPHNQRANVEKVIERLRNATRNVEGISLFMQAAQDLQIDSRISRTQFQYILQDADAAELADWTPKLVQKLGQLPQLSDVASDQQTNGLQLNVDVDREKASRLNVLTQAIDDTLYDAFGQRQVSIIFTQLNQFRVILEVEPKFRESPDLLDKIYVKSSSGQPVPLSAFASVHVSNAPLSIPHQGQFPAATISFNLRSGSSLSHAIPAIEKAEREIGLPNTIAATFTGAAAEFRSSLTSEPFLILAAVVVIYIVLGVLYESYIHPITILSTLPSAGVGALLALLICRIDFSLVALIGIILLIGIVKKNAIMMIDFALEAERKEGMSPEESIYQACLLRFRPIMMTTAAALLGALPLALETGSGSELRRPLGISIVGGLLLSQFLTLYTTPVIYLYLDRFGSWIGGRRSHARIAQAELPLRSTSEFDSEPEPEFAGVDGETDRLGF